MITTVTTTRATRSEGGGKRVQFRTDMSSRVEVEHSSRCSGCIACIYIYMKVKKKKRRREEKHTTLPSYLIPHPPRQPLEQ